MLMLPLLVTVNANGGLKYAVLQNMFLTKTLSKFVANHLNAYSDSNEN